MPRHDPVPERVASVTELRRASAKRPAQVAMVVMQCARLHLGLGAPQSLLPMGTLVTALYRDHEWICVQTPHGVRGFVRHTSCAPLGSLAPKPARGRKVSARRAASKMSSVYGGTISAASSVDNLTLRRNMVHHRGNRGRAAEKVLEKNIDKLVWGSAADLPDTKLVATLEALKIEASNGSLNSARQ